MSVIVMGIFMPNTCEECLVSCEVGSDMHCLVSSEPNDAVKGGLFWRKSECGFDRRPDWCPLRPLPEKHGGLIDAKVLDAAFTALRFNDDGTLRHWDDRKNWCLHGSEVESLIADAPTIVEAEGE